MLSFIYRLANDFERLHGQRPNVLYLRRFHFEHLRQGFADPRDTKAMMSVLGMAIMITEEAVNPRLARMARPLPLLVTGAEHAALIRP